MDADDLLEKPGTRCATQRSAPAPATSCSAVIEHSRLRWHQREAIHVRAGFCAALSAAVADQPWTLRGIHYIERCDHRPFEKVPSLGLVIRRS